MFWERHGANIKLAIYALMILGYAVYFGFAMSYEFGSESSIRLLWMTMLAVFIVLVSIISDKFGDKINKYVIQPPVNFINRHWMLFKW